MRDQPDHVQTQVWQAGELSRREDRVARESAVALVYNGVSHVVMMLTPHDLEDFALGFSLSEGIVHDRNELLGVDVVAQRDGLELQLEITTQRFAQLKERRRNLTGRTGCGLCGAESLEQAVVPARPVTPPPALVPEVVQNALHQLDASQPLQAETGAVHGAMWCNLEGQILLAREDVGRHNALDKLLGALRKSDLETHGFVLITSRASYEMVNKVAAFGLSTLVAVSAATSLAIEQAGACGMQLIGFARPGRQVRYT